MDLTHSISQECWPGDASLGPKHRRRGLKTGLWGQQVEGRWSWATFLSHISMSASLSAPCLQPLTTLLLVSGLAGLTQVECEDFSVTSKGDTAPDATVSLSRKATVLRLPPVVVLGSRMHPLSYNHTHSRVLHNVNEYVMRSQAPSLKDASTQY